MPPWGPDFENKMILFYSILFVRGRLHTGAYQVKRKEARPIL